MVASSSSLTSLTSILVSISPRVRGVRVAQAGFTLVPLPGLMLASVSCVLDRVHGVVEDLGLNSLLVSPRVYPAYNYPTHYITFPPSMSRHVKQY